MKDRLGELLDQHDVLYGVICRDATHSDVELMAQAGYHVVWLDLEHSPQSHGEALRLGRMATHLGMVPLVRIPELTRSHVQVLLDGGAQVLTLPDVRDAAQAARFVQLGKFPPLGERGASTTTPSTGYTLGTDPQRTFREANEATRLMVMIESDEGYEALDQILAVDGIDMVTVGQLDWSVGIGAYSPEAKAGLTPKVESVFTAAAKSGKIVTAGASNADEAAHYVGLGARVLFVGVDVALKRRALFGAIEGLKGAPESR